MQKTIPEKAKMAAVLFFHMPGSILERVEEDIRGKTEMRTLLESSDVQAIAERVVELILPILNQSREQDDSILNTEQVSRLLGKSKGQVYQWVNNSSHGLNDFPFLKAGKSLRFSKTAIIQWMQKHGNIR